MASFHNFCVILYITDSDSEKKWDIDAGLGISPQNLKN